MRRKTTKMNTENTKLSAQDVRPGDMILYVLDAKPQFLPFTRENAWPNFCVLIDRLIIAMGGSMCTHAALAAPQSDTVVEATLPYCRYRPGIYCDGYTVLVRRVSAPGKGALVLDYLPEGIVYGADPHDNLPYAYAQSAVAAFLCLFRHKASVHPAERKALLVFLQMVLHPLAKKIDEFIASAQGKSGAWFCSQLVMHCYDRAAETDSDYRLRFPLMARSRERFVDTLFDSLPPLAADMSGLLAVAENRPLDRDSLSFDDPAVLRAGLTLLEIIEDDFKSPPDMHMLSAVATERTPDGTNAEVRVLQDAHRFLTLLAGDRVDLSTRDAFYEYVESLVMPSDLEKETGLLRAGYLHDHT